MFALSDPKQTSCYGQQTEVHRGDDKGHPDEYGNMRGPPGDVGDPGQKGQKGDRGPPGLPATTQRASTSYYIFIYVMYV